MRFETPEIDVSVRVLAIVIALSLSSAGLALLLPQGAQANPDFTKKTGKKCVYCHVGDWTSGKYTEAGEFYREHRTFKGYVPKG
jgi:hypothetical protein